MKNKYERLSEEEKMAIIGLCLDVENNIKIDSVILSEDNVKKVKSFIQETEFKYKFIKAGLHPINRLLLYGTTGTGKTYLTKALANHFDYTLLAINIAQALSTGNAATSIEKIFTIGNKLGNCIIFLDECDSLCWDRGDRDNADDASVRRANNALFQMLDKLNPACMFVSATNMYKNLDVAFVRRFNIQMLFERPEIKDLDITIQKFLLPGFKYIQDCEPKVKDILKEQGKIFTGLSYYGIKDWVERAEKLAIINDTETVKESDVYSFFMESIGVYVSDGAEGMYLHQRQRKG